MHGKSDPIYSILNANHKANQKFFTQYFWMSKKINPT